MQLARILFAGALLFGVGCEPFEEEASGTDQRVDPASLDHSIDHDSERVAYEDQASNYKIDENLRMEGRTLPDAVCTLDLSRLTDMESAELQDILNTAIVDDEFALARLAPEQMARIQAILASAIVM